MAAKIEPLVTVEDLESMPEDGNRYEVIEGEIFVSRAPGIPHQLFSVNIAYEFKRYLALHPVGLIVPTAGLAFDKHSGVIPDLVFFTHERSAAIIENDRLVAAPDIAIEILSAGAQNIARDRIVKRQLYAKHGVNEYWIVDGENRAIEVYRLTTSSLSLAAVLNPGDEITSPLLPGFSCPVSNIFETVT